MHFDFFQIIRIQSFFCYVVWFVIVNLITFEISLDKSNCFLGFADGLDCDGSAVINTVSAGKNTIDTGCKILLVSQNGVPFCEF